MHDLYNYYNPKTRKVSPMISTETYEAIKNNSERLNSAIIYDRDYNYNYFGFKVQSVLFLTTYSLYICCHVTMLIRIKQNCK